MFDRAATNVLAHVLVMINAVLGPPEPTDGGSRRRDRGDVPGWVMITVMTAIVVIALLAVFKDQVVKAVGDAFTSVRDSDKK